MYAGVFTYKLRQRVVAPALQATSPPRFAIECEAQPEPPLLSNREETMLVIILEPEKVGERTKAVSTVVGVVGDAGANLDRRKGAVPRD